MSLKNFLVKIYKLKINKSRKIYKENFLQNGQLDSIEFIEAINEIEKKYNIKFKSTDFKSNKNFTINNLISIIKKKNGIKKRY